MPVIGLPVEELTSRIGRELSREELLLRLQEIGCDVDGYESQERARCAACGWVHEVSCKEEPPAHCERCQADLRSSSAALLPMPPQEVVRMDLLAVRPDLFDPGGLARALRGILSIELGLADYAVGPPSLVLKVDPSVRRSTSSRPCIACAVLENVLLDENRIKILMKLQENLHWALGRDRKHASIGVYDLESLGLSNSAAHAAALGEASAATDQEYPADLEYTTQDPQSFSFVPLGYPATDGSGERSLRQILEEHPKGVAYARLLEGFDRYPILRTLSGRVLSMPPIINSEETKVHPGSRRLFIDVTGTGERVVNKTLNILLTSYLELDRAAKLHGVVIDDGHERHVTPDLTPREAWCDVSRASRLIGVDLSSAELKDLLRRMRHGIAEGERVKESGVSMNQGIGASDVEDQSAASRVRVLVPAYRNDILHEHDLIEDAAIAYGYSNIPPTLVPTQTIGRELPLERKSEQVREVLIGLGLTEIMSLVLTCPEQSDLLFQVPEHPAAILVENPISQEQVQLRTSLLPGILSTLARNRHNPLPQGIFEVGDVTFLESEAETGAAEHRHLAFGLIAPKVGFADLRSMVEAVVREFGWKLSLIAHEAPFLLEGRGAKVLGSNGTWTGLMGEVHPRVLERLGLQNPTVVFEMTLPDADGAQRYGSFTA